MQQTHLKCTFLGYINPFYVKKVTTLFIDTYGGQCHTREVYSSNPGLPPHKPSEALISPASRSGGWWLSPAPGTIFSSRLCPLDPMTKLHKDIKSPTPCLNMTQLHSEFTGDFLPASQNNFSHFPSSTTFTPSEMWILKAVPFKIFAPYLHPWVFSPGKLTCDNLINLKPKNHLIFT